MTAKTTINQAELNKFDKTHDDWWDADGEFAILHQINPLRIDYINRQIDLAGKKNCDIIDVGTGGGLVSVALADKHKVMALDANSKNVESAATQAKKMDRMLSTYCGAAEEYIANNKTKYDVVICLEVIEHVADPEFLANTLTKLAKDDGIIIISTINRNLKSLLLAKVMAEYVLGFVKAGTHDYQKFIRPSSLSKMLEPNGWNITNMQGMSYDILASCWHLSNNIDVNYFATFKKNS